MDQKEFFDLIKLEYNNEDEKKTPIINEDQKKIIASSNAAVSSKNEIIKGSNENFQFSQVFKNKILLPLGNFKVMERENVIRLIKDHGGDVLSSNAPDKQLLKIDYLVLCDEGRSVNRSDQLAAFRFAKNNDIPSLREVEFYKIIAESYKGNKKAMQCMPSKMKDALFNSKAASVSPKKNSPVAASLSTSSIQGSNNNKRKMVQQFYKDEAVEVRFN